MARVALHVTVAGAVQGVGYRAWAAREAERLGLAGWVRNRRDGTVEAVVAGEGAAVEAFVARCRAGPPSAVVTAVATAAHDGWPGGGFSVRPTA